MKPCTSQPEPPKKQKNPAGKKLLLFSEVELSSSNIKKIIMFSIKSFFLYFWK